MSNDLYKPLTKKQASSSRLRFGIKSAVGLVVLIAGGLAARVILVDDPLGGEPHQIIAMPVIPPPPEKTADKTQEGSTAQDEMESALKDVPTGPTVRILTPGEGEMQVQTVALANENGVRLNPAPDARIIEKTRLGLLPKVSETGDKAFKVYARPFERGQGGLSINAPRIAILIGGLGLSQVSTIDALTRLPADMTLAFAPYGTQLQTQIDKAREKGHEVMLQVPMEPYDFPANDPGPQTLLTSLSRDDNLERLYWSLTRFTGYTGVTNHMGAKFTANNNSMRQLLQEVARRGLSYVDDGSSPRSRAAEIAKELNMAHAKGFVTIDAVPSPEKIDEALSRLEEQAKEKGQALGVASALPLSIDRLTRWSENLQKRGIALVPVSAVIVAPPGS